MKSRIAGPLGWSLILAGLVASVLLRGALLRARVDLQLAPRLDPVSARGSFGARAAESRLVVTSAALGIFRALAIDYLWIRAIRMQERGQFFECMALGDLITELQPRLPDVWRYQARTLAYDITASLPAEERYPWVRAGIDLLRDRALLFNPGSPSIHLELAFFFQHKCGLDLDEAGYLYRSELARAFEVERGSPAWRQALSDWRIDLERLSAIEEEWGVLLDLRAAESQALYWAAEGAAATTSETEAIVRRGLRNTLRASLQQLFSGGRPVRSPFSPYYAFLPDLGAAAAARRAIELEMQRAVQFPRIAGLLGDMLLQNEGQRVFLLFLHGRAAEARAALASAPEVLRLQGPGLEEFLLASISYIAGEPDAPVPGGELPEAVGARALVSCLDAALYSELAGEATFAEGLRALGRLVHERLRIPAGEGDRPSFEACLGAAARRRAAGWLEDPRIPARLPPTIRDLLASTGPTASELGLPERPRLPFRLELLDPRWGEGMP